ncbi:MAG: acyltransferase [Bacteroidota bacterium]
MNSNLADYFAHETALVEEPVQIGNRTKIWHFCHVMPHAEIGEGCSLGQNVFVASRVKLGNNVKIQNNVSLYEGVICEDDVFLGPSMVFTNVRNPRSAVIRKSQYAETYLEKGATIGANATIVCGVRLGHHCFIGAGTVVTKNVPPYALIVGNPGRQLGWMSEYGHRLSFEDTHIATCPESKDRYELKDGLVHKLDN